MKLFHILNIKSVYKTKNIERDKFGQLPANCVTSFQKKAPAWCGLETLMSHAEQEEEDEEGRQKNEERDALYATR